MGAPRPIDIEDVIKKIDFLSDKLVDLSQDTRVTREKSQELQMLARDWNQMINTFNNSSQNKNQIPELYRLALRIQTEYKSMGLTVKLDEEHPPQSLERIFNLNMGQFDRYMSENFSVKKDKLSAAEAKIRVNHDAQITAAEAAVTKADKEVARKAAEKDAAEAANEKVAAARVAAAKAAADTAAAAKAVADKAAEDAEKIRAAESKREAEASAEREARDAAVKEKSNKVKQIFRQAAAEIENIKLALEDIGKNNPEHAVECLAAIHTIDELMKKGKLSFENDKKIHEFVQDLQSKFQNVTLKLDNDPEVLQDLSGRGIVVNSGSNGVHEVNATDMLSKFNDGLGVYLKNIALNEIEMMAKKIGITENSHTMKKIMNVLDDSSIKVEEKQAALLKIAKAAQGNIVSQAMNQFFGSARSNEKNQLYSFIINNLGPAADMMAKVQERTPSRSTPAG